MSSSPTTAPDQSSSVVAVLAAATSSSTASCSSPTLLQQPPPSPSAVSPPVSITTSAVVVAAAAMVSSVSSQGSADPHHPQQQQHAPPSSLPILPVLNVPGELGFLMQCGLAKDSVTIETSDLNLKSLKDLACNFIDRKVCLSPLVVVACRELRQKTKLPVNSNGGGDRRNKRYSESGFDDRQRSTAACECMRASRRSCRN